MGDVRVESDWHGAAVIDAALAQVEPGDGVAIVGGEPTRFGGLADVVRRARDRGATDVLVPTGGRALAVEGYAETLAAAGVTLVDVALHGPAAPLHDYLTGVPGGFRQAVAGLRRARAAGLGVGVTALLSRANYRHAAEIVRLAHAVGVHSARLLAMTHDAPPAHPRFRPLPAASMTRPHVALATALAARLELPCALEKTSAAPSHGGWLRASPSRRRHGAVPPSLVPLRGFSRSSTTNDALPALTR